MMRIMSSSTDIISKMTNKAIRYILTGTLLLPIELSIISCSTTSVSTVHQEDIISKNQYIQEKDANAIVSDYRSNPDEKHQKIVPALLSLFKMDEQQSSYSDIAIQINELPEMRDGVSSSEIRALEDLLSIYRQTPNEFEATFKRMDQIGIRGKRKFNTPLQALFWLAEDGKLNKDIIQNYNLRELLNKAWTNENAWKTMFTKEDKEKIISGIEDKNIRQNYETYFRTFNEAAVKRILHDVEYNPSIFSGAARKVIMNAKKSGPRWNDFSTVKDRLNAPELVNLYIKLNYSYRFEHGMCCQAPKTTFTEKSGCCVCLALLGKRFLDNAGYKTFIRHLKGSRCQHGVLVTVFKGEYYIVVDFTKSGNNAMSGPFKNISEVDNEISKFTGTPVFRRIWIGQCGS